MILRIREFFAVIGNNFAAAFRTMNGWDVLDIAIVSLLLYYLFFFIRDRRAGKLALGVCVLALTQILCDAMRLDTTLFLLDYLFEVGLVALVVIFQPELRTLLGKMGGEMIHGLRSGSKDTKTVAALCTACATMAKDKVGALIVLERRTRLGDIVGSGTVLDAEVSAPLLCNVFQNKAPLHDGAVVIKNGRISAAGCFLPLSASDVIHNLGTRHRAALGMSEASDAVVIVVSEETGTISIACNGSLTRNYDYASLQRELSRLLGEKDTEEQLSFWKRLQFWRGARKQALYEDMEGADEETVHRIWRKDIVFRVTAAVASLALSVVLWVYATGV